MTPPSPGLNDLYPSAGAEPEQKPKKSHKATRITAGAIERDLEPVTTGTSSLLATAGLEPLAEDEAGAWRASTARVLEKYQRMWILPELIWLVLTLSMVLSRMKGAPVKYKALGVLPVFGVFGLMLVGARKLAAEQAPADSGGLIGDDY